MRTNTSISLSTVTLAALAFCSSLLHAESPLYQVFGKERLAAQGTFNGYTCDFLPASGDKPATVDYPAGKWSALIMTLPVDGKMGGSMIVRVKAKWEADAVKNGVGAGLALMFMDSDGKTVGEGAQKFLPSQPGAQDVTAEARVPKDAVTFRADISSGKGGGVLDVTDYTVLLRNVDLAMAAAKGVSIPWLKVPGGQAHLPMVAPEAAQAPFVATAPTTFDDPAWSTLPTYPISTTTSNKTVPGDVSAQFQMAWTPDNLFIKFHAHDKILNFTGKDRSDRDCFELFLMPTGASGANDMVTKEQYAVSCTPDGKTDSNGEATTRTTEDGWEAILKVPMKTEGRRIMPFNGLAMTFNAAYHDSNTLPQEHWLSFSKADQTNSSWADASVYVPLIFTSDSALDYNPIWKGDSLTYNVDPKFPGRINLIHTTATLDNLETWDQPPDLPIEAFKDGDHECFRIRYTPDAEQPRAVFTMSPFNTLAGETLNLEVEAHVDAGPSVSLPDISYLAESNWQILGFQKNGSMIDQWQKFQYTLVIPDRMRDNLRNGRLIWSFAVAPGRTIEIRDIKLTRRLPADFDALISTPGRYSHFWQGEPGSVKLTLNSGVDAKAKVSAKVVDYFSGKTLLSKDWDTDVAKDTTSSMDWDVSALPNGFFNVVLKVRDDQGHFLADRELYVSKGVKSAKLSKFNSLFLCSGTTFTAPRDIPETISMLRDSGIGMIQYADSPFFDSKGNPLGSRWLDELKALHEAGFETGLTASVLGSHSLKRNWRPYELKSYYDSLLTFTKGLWTHMSFSNEPNLDGGWDPGPDAREWAIFNRTFYTELQRLSPETQGILGSFNDIPTDYIRTAETENLQSFAYPAIGLHLYGTEPNSDGGFMDMLNKRKELDATHPGWDAWDTESGMVYYSFRNILDLQSKKPAMMMTSGYTRSYFFNNWDLIFPCADSTPLLPMSEFVSVVYQDMSPLGYLTMANGKVHVFLFQDSTGHGMASMWNISHDDQEIDLPISGSGELFDVYGNSLSKAGDGTTHLKFTDRNVQYLKGVNVAALMKDSTFVPAFKSASKPAPDAGYTTMPYLTMPAISRAFDREVTIGAPSDVSIAIVNEDQAPVKLTLKGEGPDGLKISLEDNGAYTIAPGEFKAVTVTLLASKEISPTNFSIVGETAEGKKILPLVFGVKTTPPVAAEGYSRAVEVKNNSATASDVELTPSKTDFFFKPSVLKATLAPGASAVLPVAITRKQGYQSYFSMQNTPVFYTLNVHSPQGDYTQQCNCIFFVPGQGDTAPADFTKLPYTALPEHPSSEPFQVNYNLTWVGDGLRIVARVQDSSPMQGHDNGQLKKGGDCMIVAMDASSGTTPEALGAAYFECGFAVYGHTPVSYGWDGKNGLEAAGAFPGTVTKIERDANYIYYDVTIPKAQLLPADGSEIAGLSIAFVNRDTDGKDQLIELGKGIFPDRNAAELGLLSKQQ
jgi:Carbohydrate family 9 binding domain-like